MIYHLRQPFVIDVEAPGRFADPTFSEATKAETCPYLHGWFRCIGGDLGDLLFDGYEVANGKTTLANVALCSVEGLTDDEVMDTSREIFDAAFASIGIECVTHN